MPETETAKCPACGLDNPLTTTACVCGFYLKSEIECLRAIDEALPALLRAIRDTTTESRDALKTIRRIAIWFFVLSILGLLLGLLVVATGGFR